MQPDDENQLTTLEETETTVQAGSEQAVPMATVPTDTVESQAAAPPPKQRMTGMRLRAFLNRINIYLVVFLVIVALAITAIVIGVRWNSREEQAALDSTTLSEGELANLRGTDARVGDPKQTLSIESNTIFSGKVLVRDNLDVAGTIKVGGALNLPGITVAGNSSFDQVQASQLNVSGNTTLQGTVSVQRNLSVTGGASFGGAVSAPQLNIQTLQLSGDLQLNRHIDGGGGTPGKSDGGSLGGGGTASVSGSDTAGTVTINTGGSPSAGCYITVNFAQRFNASPHVVITPVGSGSASLNYYVNRSNTNFSVCSTTVPAGSSSFSFDYIVID